MRAECQEVETGLSFLRRVVQGRLDIVAAELARRRDGGEPADLAALVEQLPTILADHLRAPGNGRLPNTLGPGHLDAELEARRRHRGHRASTTSPPSPTTIWSPSQQEPRELEARDLRPAPRPLRSHRRPPGRAHPPLPNRRGRRSSRSCTDRRPAPSRHERSRATRSCSRWLPSLPSRDAGRRRGQGWVETRWDELGRVHPRAAPGRPPVAAEAVGPGRDLQPLPEPDRAGPAEAVGGDPPADRPGPRDQRRDALRPGRDPRGAHRHRRSRR